MIPGTVNGKIQLAPGYRRFFIWVLISAIPAIILSRFVPIRSVAAGPATPSIEA
jgi:MFS transporter, PAT family, beta-lactamase induction signal transducer AmpG